MPSDKFLAAIHNIVAVRAQGHCEYCQTPELFATQSFAAEYVLPLGDGGTQTLENYGWLCFGCSSHRPSANHGLDPETGEPAAFYHPRQQAWTNHFTWNTDETLIVGKTATGRATLAALNLNRPGLIRLRGILAGSDYHPPAHLRNTP